MVYEGFIGYSDIEATTAPNSSTIGLNQTIPYAGNNPAGLSIGTGLTLSNLQVGGGSGAFAGSTVVAGAQLDLPAAYTGTLWGSYLVNLTVKGGGSGNGSEVRIGDDDSTGGIRFRGFSDSRGAFSNTFATSYDVTLVDAPESLVNNTTYLVLSSFTNVGLMLNATTTMGVATSYALTAAQFDSLIAAPDRSAYLEAATVSGGQVSARVQDTITTGTFGFATGNRLQFVEVGDSGRVDEIRYGAALDDVIPVIPEPNVGVMLLGGLGLMSLPRRRRR